MGTSGARGAGGGVCVGDYPTAPICSILPCVGVGLGGHRGWGGGAAVLSEGRGSVAGGWSRGTAVPGVQQQQREGYDPPVVLWLRGPRRYPKSRIPRVRPAWPLHVRVGLDPTPVRQCPWDGSDHRHHR